MVTLGVLPFPVPEKDESELNVNRTKVEMAWSSSSVNAQGGGQLVEGKAWIRPKYEVPQALLMGDGERGSGF